MKEQLISFETAKLANEKGFEQNPYYIEKCYAPIYTDGSDIIVMNSLKNPVYNIAVAPTQALLQKWLREKYKIFVDCSHSRINDDGEVTLYQTQITSVSTVETYNFKHHKESIDCYGETYEEALEKGLQEALKLIKV